MRRTRQGRPEALVSRATLFASFPVVNILKQSTAFSVTDMSTCTIKPTQILAHDLPVSSNILWTLLIQRMQQKQHPDEVKATCVSIAEISSKLTAVFYFTESRGCCVRGERERERSVEGQ